MKVTVRTLDSKSYSFDIDDGVITVADFKKHIVDTVNIPVDTQRLIFKGKVLEDSKPLRDYGVADCVLHLVHKPPPSERSAASSRQTTGSATRNSTHSSRRTGSNRPPGPNTSVFVGQLPTTNEIGGVTQQIVDSLISQFGAGNVHTNLRQTPRGDAALNVEVNVQSGPTGQNADIERHLQTSNQFIARARQILENIQSDLMVNSGPSDSTPESDDNVTPLTNESSSSSEVPMVTEDTPSSESRQPADGEASTNTHPDSRQLGNNPQSLASVYREILSFHQDLQPTIERYENLLLHPDSSHTTSDDRLPDQISEIMHCLSHAYHALSDVSYSVGGTNQDSLMLLPQLSAIRMPPTIRNITQVRATPPTSVPSSGASPTVGAGPASGWPTPGLAPIGQGRPSQSSSSSIQASAPGTQVQFVQGTPIAVAAISTVIRIPVGANALTQTAASNTTTTTSSAHSDSSREGMNSQETATSNASSQSSQQQNQTFQALFNPFSGIFPGQGTIRAGVTRGGPNGSATFTQHFSGSMQPTTQGTQGFGNQDSGPLPLGLQNIMQNIMQSFPNIGQNQTPASSNTSSASSTSVTSSSSNVGTSVSSVTPPQPPQRSASLPHHHHHHHTAPTHCHHHHHHPPPTRQEPESDAVECDNPHHHHHHHHHSNPDHHHHHHHHPPPHHCDNPHHRHPAPNQCTNPNHNHHSPSRGPQPTPNNNPIQLGNMMSNPVNHPDPLLPCQSYHFGPVFVQGRPANQVVEVASIMLEHPQGQSSNGGNGQNVRMQNATPGSNEGGQMADVSQILNGIFGNLSQTNGQGNAATPMPVAVNMRIETDDVHMDNDEEEEENEIDLDQMHVVQQVQDTFIGMLNRATGQSSGTAGNQNTDSVSNTSASSETSTVGGVQPQRTPGTAPDANSQSLRSFLLQSTGIPDIQGDDLFSDFMVLLMDHLSLPDMISMFMGASTEPYQRLQVPTQQFVARHFNGGQPFSESDYERVAEQMSAGMSSINAETQPHLTVRTDVDLDATLRKLDQQYFLRFLKLLFGNNSEFATEITQWYTDYTAWTFAVLDYAVTGGAEDYLRACLQSPVIQNALSSMDTTMNQLVVSTLTQRIRSATANTTITQEQVLEIIVRPGARPRDTRTNPYKEKDDLSRAAKRTKRNEKVDLDQKWEQICSVNGHASSESDSEQDGSPISEDWHSDVPNDWVLVISRDVERQRQLPRQRPYSDAYINGVSSKRRALLTPHPESADMIDVAATLKKSAEKVGTKPKTSFEELKSDIENLDIQKEFDAAFRADMEKRLHMDDDYRPNRHSNVDKYFMKRKRKSSDK